MGQFSKYSNFKFDGIDSRNFGLQIVQAGSDSESNNFIYGLNRSINEDEGVGEVPIFKGIKYECPEIDVTLSKFTSLGEDDMFTNKDYEEISRWLFKNEYKPLEVGGFVYYVIFTGANGFRNGNYYGYINLKLRLSAPYAYSRVQTQSVIVEGKKDIKLYNNSSVQQYLFPDVHFELYDNTSEVTIINSNNMAKMEFKNLIKNDEIYVYNDGLKQIVSLKDASRNIFKLFNGDFLKLVYGRNNIRIVCNGKIKLNIIHQCKVALY